jgi:Domain of unknown function (DUF6391)
MRAAETSTWVRWFFVRPILPFAIQLIILTPLILAEDPRAVGTAYLFVSPGLLPLFAVLNLPFVFGAFRAFHLDPRTKRNHALEHATILILEAESGRRFAGRAHPNGFRICGHTTASEIKAAFERVRRVVESGGELACVSRRCGSNVVTALALAMGLLTLVAVASIVFRPSLFVRAGALIAVVLMFVGLRRAIGNAIQRRFFLSADFIQVSLRGIRGVPQKLLDRGPVHFVETLVVPRSGSRSGTSTMR